MSTTLNVSLNDIAGCIKEGNAQSLKDMLFQKFGGDININQLCAELGGMAPLHFAAYIGDVEILDLILSLHNVDVDFRDCDGNTALHFAAVMDKLASVHLLLNSNAKVHLVNSAGKSPLDYAKRSEIRELLTERHRQSTFLNRKLGNEVMMEIENSLPSSVEELKDLVMKIVADHYNFEEMTKETVVRLLEEKHIAHHNLRLMEHAVGIHDKETASNYIDQLCYLEEENENQSATIANLRMQLRMLDQTLKEQAEQSAKSITQLIEQHTLQLQQILDQNEESEKAFNAYQQKLTQEFEEITRLRNENVALKKKLLSSYSRPNLNELEDKDDDESAVIKEIESEGIAFEQKIQDLTAEKQALAEKIKNIGKLNKRTESDLKKPRDLVQADILAKMNADRAKQDEVDESSGKIVFCHGENGIRQIKAATSDKLIERLTDGTHYNNQFVPAFLLTFREFIEKGYLLDQLMRKFNDIGPETSGIASPIRLKICNVIKMWIENYWFDFEGDSKMMSDINAFISQIEPNYERAPVNCPKPILPKNLKRTSSTDILTAPAAGAAPVLDKNGKAERSSVGTWTGLSFMSVKGIRESDMRLKFLDIDPLEMARQLTLIEHRLFTAIKPTEFLNQAWLKDDKEIRAPNICKMTRWSNHVVHWVVTEIVTAPDSQSQKARAMVMERFVQVASHLEKLNNFNGLKEILAGLQSSAVHRLKKTRLAVSSKSLKMFEDLNKQTSSDLNFKTLRARIHACDPPLIPFPGVYQGDLVFLDTGSRSRVEGGLVNFQKCQKIMSYIAELQTYQQSFYHLEAVQEIMDYVKNYETLPDEQAYDRSLICEPRGQ